MRSLVLCLVPALAMGAQLAGPISGYVFDPAARSLRPIHGLPGSATLGGPLALPFPVGVAAASPELDYALATGPRGGQVSLITGLRSGQPATAPLGGAIAANDLVLSSSGAAALLYSTASAEIQFVAGLPSGATAGAPVDASQAGAVTAMAVNAAGTSALLLAADGSLYSAAPGHIGLVSRIPGAGSVAILPNGTDALVGNATTGDVLLVKDFATSAAISTLAGAAQGIDSARDIAALDAHHAAVIDGGGRLAVIDLDTAAVNWVALAGPAERFAPLDAGLLLLNRPGAQPLLLIAAAQGGTAYFVPPAAGATGNPVEGGARWTRR